VHRGWDPTSPSRVDNRAPVADDVVIKSGQVISLSYNSEKGYAEWVLGASDTAVPQFARQDSDDFDVVASGVLNGLSSLENGTLSTAYFDDADHTVGERNYTSNYALEAYLSASEHTPGNVVVAIQKSGRAILGRVSRRPGPHNLNESTEGRPPAVSNVVPYQVAGAGDYGVWVITLDTHFDPNRSDNT